MKLTSLVSDVVFGNLSVAYNTQFVFISFNVAARKSKTTYMAHIMLLLGGAVLAPHEAILSGRFFNKPPITAVN